MTQGKKTINQTNVDEGNLNVKIPRISIQKANARASMLGIDLKDYINRLILIDYERKMNLMLPEEIVSVVCSNPKCRTLLVAERDQDIIDCPICGTEVIVNSAEVVHDEY